MAAGATAAPIDPSDVQVDSAAIPASDVQVDGAAGSKGSSALSDFAAGAWSKLNPLNILSGLAQTAEAVKEHPIDTAQGILLHQYAALGRAKDAWDAGQPAQAAMHLMSAIEPGGIATEDSAVKAVTPGQTATGLGELLGTGLGTALMAKTPEIAKVTANAAKPLLVPMAKAATTPAGSAIAEGAGMFAGLKMGGGWSGAYVGRLIAKAIIDKLKDWVPAAEAEPGPAEELPAPEQPNLVGPTSKYPPARPPQLPLPPSRQLGAAPASAAEGPASGPPPQLLDQIAMQLKLGKSFDDLSATQQDAVRSAAQRYYAPQVETNSGVPGLDTSALREIPAPVRSEMAAANYRAWMEGAPAADVGPAYKSVGQLNKSQSVAQALKGAGKTHADLLLKSPSDLQTVFGNLAKLLGINKTGAYSTDSVKLTMDELKILEGSK